MTKIWWILFWAFEILKISTLIGSFCAKYITFDLRKYGGVIFYDNEDWCKIWIKTDLWFRKWHEEYSKFSPEQLKVSKVRLWWDPLIQSRKCVSLKLTDELCVMKMKNDAKFEEVMGSFWAKYILFELKKYRGIVFRGTESDAKFGEELTCYFKNDIRNLTNFDQALESLKNFHLIWLLLSKVYIVWTKKVHRSYLSRHWRVMQNWRGTDLSFQNWHEEFDKLWPNTQKSQKFHFNRLFLTKVYDVWAKNIQRSYVR